MEVNQIQSKTIILEQKEGLYTRVRTQCDDQNHVRDYYMGQVSIGAAIAACAYLLDMLMDISLLNLGILESQANLTPEQNATFIKLKLYHELLRNTSLQQNQWEMDWVYVDVKHQQDLLNIEFFKKRKELELGIPLPDPIPNPVPFPIPPTDTDD